MKREFVTSTSRGPTQADLNALKAKVDSLLATNARRPAGPPPSESEISHQIRRAMAPLLIDLEEAGYDTTEVKANLQRLTTNAQDWRSQYQPPAADDYIAPELLSHELPGGEPQSRTATNGAASCDYMAPELLSNELPGGW